MLFFPTLKLPAHYIIGWEIGVKRFFCELAPKSGRVKNGSFTDRFSETGGWLKIDLVASSLSSFSNATICWPRWKHHFHNTPPPPPASLWNELAYTPWSWLQLSTRVRLKSSDVFPTSAKKGGKQLGDDSFNQLLIHSARCRCCPSCLTPPSFVSLHNLP